MKLRPFLKILLLCFLPSLALIIVAAWYLGDLIEPLFPPTVEGQARGKAVAEIVSRIAWTGIWLSLGLCFLTVIGYLLSPELARKRSRPEMPALLRDLICYGLLIIVIAFILRAVWGSEVTPLIGALGVGGVVLGFALQETLSNFFAGLALLAERPFTQGDWVRVGDKVEGMVEHVTWRATKIRTRDNDYQIFPNNLVAKEVIINYRQPSRVHAIRLEIGTGYDDPPDQVKRTVHEVLASVPAVLKDPPASVYLKAYASSSINYEVKCFIEDYDRRPVIEDQIMHRLWYIFRRKGIEIPFPIQTVYQHNVPPDQTPRKGLVDVEKVLAAIPIFTAFSRDEVAMLAAGAQVLSYGAGEPVIRQGDPGDTLYVIVSGSARVAIRAEDGSERSLATLGAGEVFGEMSLLTGDPRTASVYAEDGLILGAVSRGALLPLLIANPAVAEKMAEIVTLRKQGLDRAHTESPAAAAKRPEVQTATRGLLARIRGFFALG